MLTLSPLDYALIKVARLEKEAEDKEIRLSALRCRVTELLAENEAPVIIVRKGGDHE